MNSGESRIESIQALRGIAVLSVIGFHFHQVGYRYVRPAALLPDWFNLGVTGVDLFFVISGFVMVVVTRGRFGHLKEVTRFAWHRATRIYPVYWLYFLLTLGALLIHPGWVNASGGHQHGSDLLPSFFLVPTGHLPLVQVSWSLIHEIWFYLVFCLLLLCRERWLPMLLLLWGLIIGAANSAGDVETFGPDLHIILHPLTFEFLLGACAALLMNIGTIRQAPALLLWGILIVIAFLGMPEVLRHEHSLEESDSMRVAVLGPLYASLVVTIALLEQKRHIGIPGLLRSLGDVSYTAYLSHLLVIGLVGHLWLTLRPANTTFAADFLLWPAMMMAVIAYAWLGYRFVERPVLDQSRRAWRLINRKVHARREMRSTP